MQYQEVISPLDWLFAERVLARNPPDSPCPSPLWLALLMAMHRRGHLCLPLDPSALKLALEPLCATTPELLDPLVEEALKGSNSSPLLHQMLGKCYLPKNWTYESDLITHLSRLAQAKPEIPFAEGDPLPQLNREQQQAVQYGLRCSLSLLTGGPGTGKTYTAAHLIRACLDQLSESQRAHFRVILAAPTGKAVAHLEKNLQKHLGPDPIGHLKTGTLHALLQVKSAPSREEDPPVLFADLILVDECSMIDAPLFARLARAVASGSRLVLIGDPDQLPPVEAGSFFADLIAAKCFPTTHLTTCLRMEQREILQLAEALRQGDYPSALPALHTGAVRRALLPMKRGRESDFSSQLISLVRERFPLPSLTEPAPSVLRALNEQFRILCCMRQGCFGVDAINHLLFENALQQAEEGTWLAVPILITRNDYTLGLYNGDTGFLVKQLTKERKRSRAVHGDYALFPDKNKQWRRIPALALRSFDIAYCLSVHQSQGSEYDEILLLAPEGAEAFGRELFYTAVTRARRAIIWEAPLSVIESALKKSSRKQSGLRERLQITLAPGL